MLQLLDVEPLCQRRAKMRLIMFYKSQHALVALPLPSVVQLPIRPHPRYPHAFHVPYCSTDAYTFSFFPRTVVQWNKLPASIAMAPSLDQFKGGLAQLYVFFITSSLCTVHTLPPPPPQTSLSSRALPLPTHSALATNYTMPLRYSQYGRSQSII